MDAENAIPSITWPPENPVRFSSAEEIHLWCWDLCRVPHVPLSEAKGNLGVFASDLESENKSAADDAIPSALSEEEQTRAKRFIFERDRRRYILAHANMRRILEQYLNIPADKITFTRNKFGKPHVADNALKFNLAHSANLAVLAISKDFEVGADIELIQGKPSELPIGQLSAKEQNALRSLSADRFLPAFFTYWTRKEALLKGTGTGFSGEPLSLEDWSTETIVPAVGYIGAVAAQTHTFTTRSFRYIR